MQQKIKRIKTRKTKDLCNEAIEYVNSPIKVGDFVSLKAIEVDRYSREDTITNGYVIAINDDNCDVKIADVARNFDGKTFTVPTDKLKKNPLFVGYDPFSKFKDMPRLNLVSYSIGSMISVLGMDLFKNAYYITDKNGKKVKMKDLNWNPFVIDKDGNKQYYQRDFCWSLEDKQNLIESIYRGIDCGKIVVREHDFVEVKKKTKNGDMEIAFYDIIDGKQRLNALYGFLTDEFPDKNGKYYSDFSSLAKRKFEDITCFTLAQMGRNTIDEDVIKVFLLVNFAGKQMSSEHLDYVGKILEKM